MPYLKLLDYHFTAFLNNRAIFCDQGYAEPSPTDGTKSIPLCDRIDSVSPSKMHGLVSAKQEYQGFHEIPEGINNGQPKHVADPT